SMQEELRPRQMLQTGIGNARVLPLSAAPIVSSGGASRISPRIPARPAGLSAIEAKAAAALRRNAKSRRQALPYAAPARSRAAASFGSISPSAEASSHADWIA